MRVTRPHWFAGRLRPLQRVTDAGGLVVNLLHHEVREPVELEIPHVPIDGVHLRPPLARLLIEHAVAVAGEHGDVAVL